MKSTTVTVTREAIQAEAEAQGWTFKELENGDLLLMGGVQVSLRPKPMGGWRIWTRGRSGVRVVWTLEEVVVYVETYIDEVR